MQNSARGPPARARADPLVLSWILTDTDELCSCCSRIRSRQGVCIEILHKCIEGVSGLAIPESAALLIFDPRIWTPFPPLTQSVSQVYDS